LILQLRSYNLCKQHKIKVHSIECKCNFEGCGKEFTNDTALRRHTCEVHNGGYMCAHCDSTFTVEYERSEHIRKAHLGGYKCKFKGCEELEFNNQTALWKHKKRSTPHPMNEGASAV